jgi:hypothetical protein
MSWLGRVLRRIADDIGEGRHREAYAVFLLGVVLVVLGLADAASIRVLVSAVLLAVTFLVFQTTRTAGDRPPGLDSVLQSRDDFGAFSQLLPGVRDLRVYGPTAVNVLVNAADIRRFVLDQGGRVQMIVQNGGAEELRRTAEQLDNTLDLASTWRSSLNTLERMSQAAGFEYRVLPFNPGFSLVVVNADSPRGYVIFESHGFQDSNIADRMHLVIRRDESKRWFDYWVGRFEAMWAAARPPMPASEGQTDAAR